jgi:hypothetical protein
MNTTEGKQEWLDGQPVFQEMQFMQETANGWNAVRPPERRPSAMRRMNHVYSTNKVPGWLGVAGESPSNRQTGVGRRGPSKRKHDGRQEDRLGQERGI